MEQPLETRRDQHNYKLRPTDLHPYPFFLMFATFDVLSRSTYIIVYYHAPMSVEKLSVVKITAIIYGLQGYRVPETR